MTNTPGDDQGQPGESWSASSPEGEEQEQPGHREQQAHERPGYWEQQAREQQAQQQYEQQPYPQQPYPPAGYPQQYAPDHPQATTVLVLGVLSLVVCWVLGPFAWVMGKKTLDEIDASGGALGGRGAANAGYILGIVATVILGLGLLVVVLLVGLSLIGLATSTRVR